MPDQRWIRPIDPMLTEFGLAFMQEQDEFAHDIFFPFVGGAEDGGYTGTYYIWEALNTLRRENTRWSDLVGARRIDVRGTSAAFLAEDWAIEAPISDKTRRNSQVPGTSIEQRVVNALTQKMLLDAEYRAQAAVDAIALATQLAGTARWDSTAAVPRTDMKTATRTIHQRIGKRGRIIAMTGLVYDDVTTRISTGSAGDVLNQAIKYVMAATGKNLDAPLLAAYFGVSRVINLSPISSDPTKHETTTIGAELPEAGIYIWNPAGATKEIYVVYQDENPGPETVMFGASFGPLQLGIDRYREERTRSDIIRAANALIEKVTCTSALYALGTVIS